MAIRFHCIIHKQRILSAIAMTSRRCYDNIVCTVLSIFFIVIIASSSQQYTSEWLRLIAIPNTGTLPYQHHSSSSSSRADFTSNLLTRSRPSIDLSSDLSRFFVLCPRLSPPIVPRRHFILSVYSASSPPSPLSTKQSPKCTHYSSARGVDLPFQRFIASRSAAASASCCDDDDGGGWRPAFDGPSQCQRRPVHRYSSSVPRRESRHLAADWRVNDRVVVVVDR